MSGILVTFLASICLTISNLLEKHAVDRMSEFSARRARHMIGILLRSRVWVAGFGTGIVGVGLVVIAFSLSPIAVVSAILGAGLSILVFTSKLFLKESVGRREYLGLIAILVAIVLISISLGSASPIGNHDSVPIVLVVTVSTTLIAGFVLREYHHVSDNEGVAFGLSAGLLYGAAVLQTKGASILVSRYGAVGSLGHIISSPYPYIFVVESVLGILAFQSGLQRGRITVVAPLTSIIASTYLAAAGMILYHESLPKGELFSILRIAGFALVLVGTWVLATGPAGTGIIETRPQT